MTECRGLIEQASIASCNQDLEFALAARWSDFRLVFSCECGPAEFVVRSGTLSAAEPSASDDGEDRIEIRGSHEAWGAFVARPGTRNTQHLLAMARRSPGFELVGDQLALVRNLRAINIVTEHLKVK